MTSDLINGITRLTADSGKLITDGRGTVGQVIWLGVGRLASEFYETDTAVEQDSIAQRVTALETDVAAIAAVVTL